MSLLQEMKMDKTAYWQAQAPHARWEALELMRQVMYDYDPSATGLERIFETDSQEPLNVPPRYS